MLRICPAIPFNTLWLLVDCGSTVSEIVLVTNKLMTFVPVLPFWSVAVTFKALNANDVEEEAAQTFADAGKADGSGKEFDWAFQAGEK